MDSKERKKKYKKRIRNDEDFKIVDIKFQSYLVTEKYCCQKLLYTPRTSNVIPDMNGMVGVVHTQRVDWYELEMISMDSKYKSQM